MLYYRIDHKFHAVGSERDDAAEIVAVADVVARIDQLSGRSIGGYIVQQIDRKGRSGKPRRAYVAANGPGTGFIVSKLPQGYRPTPCDCADCLSAAGLGSLPGGSPCGRLMPELSGAA